MADELRIGLAGLLRKAHIEGDAEFLKEGVRVLSQALMEMEVEEHVGAGRHGRSPGRMEPQILLAGSRARCTRRTARV